MITAVSQLLIEIHAVSSRRFRIVSTLAEFSLTTHSQDYSSNQALKIEDFAAWWHMLESAGLRAFSSELNYPSTAWLDYPTAM